MGVTITKLVPTAVGSLPGQCDLIGVCPTTRLWPEQKSVRCPWWSLPERGGACMATVVAGVDTHLDTFTVAVCDANGRCIDDATFSNDTEGSPKRPGSLTHYRYQCGRLKAPEHMDGA